jgi:ribosomal protein L11 methyltransferase
LARRWPALLVEAPAAGDSADIVSAILDDYGPAAIEDVTEAPLLPGGLWDQTFPPLPDPPSAPLAWRVFFENPSARTRAMAALSARCPHLALTPIDVDDEDWAARSQQSITAVAAGRFIVAPPWDVPAPRPGATVIVIEPSMGFGTGHHPTTRLSLRALSEIDMRGRQVLDVGTGSGVLAMAAALSGAVEAVGLDIDQDAIDSARASALLNTLPPVIKFVTSDFRTDPAAPADVVVANLTGGMLRTTAPRLITLIRPGGTLVISGFDESEEPDVRAAFAPLAQTQRHAEAGWVALALSRPAAAAPSPASRSRRPPGGAAP